RDVDLETARVRGRALEVRLPQEVRDAAGSSAADRKARELRRPLGRLLAGPGEVDRGQTAQAALLREIERLLAERDLLVVHGAIAADRAFPADDVLLLLHRDVDPEARVRRAVRRREAARHHVARLH